MERATKVVPTAHPGTFEIVPKEKKGINKGRSRWLYEKFEVLIERWLIIAMLFLVEIVSVCVCGPKIRLKSKQFPH